MEQPELKKCYVRNYRYDDDSVLTFHTVCDNWEIPKKSDQYGAGLKPDKKLVEVKDEVHFV